MNNNGYIFPDTSFGLDDIIKQVRMAHTALFTPYAIIVPPFVKRQLIEEIKLTMTRFPADGLYEDIQICGLYIVPSDGNNEKDQSPRTSGHKNYIGGKQ